MAGLRLRGGYSVLVGVLVALLVAVSCTTASTSGSPTSAPVRTIRMMAGAEPTNLLANGTSTDALFNVVYNAMEPLADGPDGSGQLVPRLATSWSHNADLTSWRFILRKGVKFHNGADFTARDVVDTAKWVIDQGKTSQTYSLLPMKDAVAVDASTVDLIFASPQPLLQTAIRFFLIYPSSVATQNRNSANTSVIGTGPYQFQEWSKGQFIKMTKFKGYWGPAPQIDNIEIDLRTEASVRVAALQAGEADWANSLSPQFTTQVPQTVSLGGSASDTVWIRFNQSISANPIFADIRLRQAIDFAIDRNALVALYSGTAPVALGQMGVKGDFGFNPDLKNRPFDLKMAKSLVAAAGAVGKEVTFMTDTDRWAMSRDVAQAIVSMIQQTGLKVKLTLVPSAEGVKYQQTQGDFRQFAATIDMFLFTSDTPGETESRAGKMFLPTGPSSGTNDPTLTGLYRQEQAELDLAKREALLQQVWAYAGQQALYVPLFKRPLIWGLAKNLQWQPDRFGTAYVAGMKFTD